MTKKQDQSPVAFRKSSACFVNSLPGLSQEKQYVTTHPSRPYLRFYDYGLYKI